LLIMDKQDVYQFLGLEPRPKPYHRSVIISMLAGSSADDNQNTDYPFRVIFLGWWKKRYWSDLASATTGDQAWHQSAATEQECTGSATLRTK
jgi:hypothetical protein